MARLEDLTPGAIVKGIVPIGLATIVAVQRASPSVATITFKDEQGNLAEELVFPDRAEAFVLVEGGQNWNVDVDGELLRLTSEALRIDLAHLFDPHIAIHSSDIEPLPHQITAVYGEMLDRQELRFLLADDPGAGKTIMAGLLIKELMLRGVLERCLIVCPGSLVEQWQAELYDRFDLNFQIMNNAHLEEAGSGNYFAENNLVIGRLDKLKSDEHAKDLLRQTSWDLIIFDEAHKLSASVMGNETRYTRRYQLAQLLRERTVSLLLLSATPHNGREADFQLFMQLLDPDRFEGRYREGMGQADTSDLMRRMVKEKLVTFSGDPLFPERRAYTVNYQLSRLELALYSAVTDYVRTEFNRADQLDTDKGRRNTVGFALMTLQRRLASSPEAIYQSLKRRKTRLEQRLREEQTLDRGRHAAIDLLADIDRMSDEDLDDLDDAGEDEIEAREASVVDRATAARTVEELQQELATLASLEQLAERVRADRTDTKWQQLSELLQDNDQMFDASGRRRKLVIFTEHRDTLEYLHRNISSLLGEEAVVVIHGQLPRHQRLRAQESFTQDPIRQILIATDAAGEGINLQRANLMVNYDLPWNPNRLEQRFGRIHRIGQTDVCHLWNLVARETREGEVYFRLLEKLEEARRALGGQVYDVLGQITSDGKSLRQLMEEAIRADDAGDDAAILATINLTMFEPERYRELIEKNALVPALLSQTTVDQVREEMERAEARRLQPHFIRAFFVEAFRQLGGTLYQREANRFEITRVPLELRGNGVVDRYERITFEKHLRIVPGKPRATFVALGHPLLEVTIRQTLERNRVLLTSGGVLIDENDPGTQPRALFYIDHRINDGRTTIHGRRQVVSRRMQFVEINPDGKSAPGGSAPYLNYRAMTDAERDLLRPIVALYRSNAEMEQLAIAFALEHIIPAHVREVQDDVSSRVRRTTQLVHERLQTEIAHWDERYAHLRDQEDAGKGARNQMNSRDAEQRRDALIARRRQRMELLAQEERLSPQPPQVMGAVLIIPSRLLQQLQGDDSTEFSLDPAARRAIELAAMEAVMAHERSLGHIPTDVSIQKLGYDIESKVPGDSHALRFIEVKGRVAGAPTVTVTRNEILTALNKPEQFLLALVQVEDGVAREPIYIRQPFHEQPESIAASINIEIAGLLARAEAGRHAGETGETTTT